ncbi:MAG: SGNH/GDSL hydrolase family protein [Candidatus Omnitrophota bacterium]|jgi:hypothetical protein
MFPRWEYSAGYGMVTPKNAKIVHGCPRRWEFTYSTNDYGLRGRKIDLSEPMCKENIIILGDSYSFGIGVDDGEEYPAVLGNKLKDKFNVINLSCGGWGLTQEIKKFYEFGRLYKPKIVIIQFCNNDLVDNFKNKVAQVRNGSFVFQDKPKTIMSWFKVLAKLPFLQKSQFYCLYRNWMHRRIRLKAEREIYNIKDGDIISPYERFHVGLLTLFAMDLKNKGIKIIMISPEEELYKFPYIKANVRILEDRGLLRYCETNIWLKQLSDFESKKGHSWGRDAHYIIGTKLADIIIDMSSQNK